MIVLLKVVIVKDKGSAIMGVAVVAGVDGVTLAVSVAVSAGLEKVLSP